MTRRTTVRGVDPAGGVDASMIARCTALLVPLYVIGVTVVQYPSYRQPLPVLLGVAVVVAASLLLWFAADPLRQRYSRGRFAMVLGAGLVAQLLEAFGGGGMHPLGFTHWAPLAVGLLLVAHSAFRPPVELVAGGVLGGVIAVPTALLPVEQLDASLLPAVLFFATPPIVLGAASAVFATTIISAAELLSRVDPFPPEAEADAVQHLARAVQQDHVTVLNREAVPLLAGLVARGRLTASDIRSAQRIADTMRATLVAGDHRTWLDAASERRGEVSDPDQLARWMSPQQRGAVRALLDFISEHSGMSPESMRIELRMQGMQCAAVLTWRAVSGTHSARAQLQPYLAVLAAVADGVELRTSGDTLRLHFNYVR